MQKIKEIEQQKEKPEFEESILYKGSLNKAIDTARYYGFKLVEPLTINKRLPNTITKAKKDSLRDKDFSDFPKDYMSILKKYIDEEMHRLAQPVMFCHIVDRPENWAELRLEILGTKKSVAEAAIIRATVAILDDLGHRDVTTRLNCIGDKESTNNFIKELTNYYREHIDNLSPTLQHQLKKDIIRVYTNRSERYKEINDSAPKPIGSLSEESREHFKQIIEFLENLDINYEISDELMSNNVCLPKTLYEIRSSDMSEILAQGERHNYLAQSIGFNKKIPIVGMGINIKRRNRKKDSYIKQQPQNKPRIYFIHLGFEAKKRSLNILETFRKSNIQVYQSLCTDSFANQLRRAENTGVPYTIIMGHKEVLENSVIFRDMETRYQENVRISELENFLSRMRKKRFI